MVFEVYFAVVAWSIETLIFVSSAHFPKPLPVRPVPKSKLLRVVIAVHYNQAGRK